MASNLRYIYIFLIHIFNQSKYFIAVFISFMFFLVSLQKSGIFYIGDWDYFIIPCGLIIKYTNYVKIIFVIIIIIIIIILI